MTDTAQPNFWDGDVLHPKLPDFLSRSLMIRYMLIEYASGYIGFHATIIRAMFASGEYLLVEYRHDPNHPSQSRIDRMDTGTSHYDFNRDRDLMLVVTDWGSKAHSYPWYAPFLKRESFVGVHVWSADQLHAQKSTVRTLPADSLRLMPFHAAIAVALGNQLRMMRQVTWTGQTQRQVEMLERLVKQFDSFCTKQQESSMLRLAAI